MHGNDFDDEYLERLSAPLPEAPKCTQDLPTVLVDVATEVENKKQYIPRDGEEKPFEAAKKKAGGGPTNVSEPVNVYEPGFRTDLYAAIVQYWKKEKRIRERNDELRKKLGLRG